MKILRLSTFLDYGGIESKMVNLSTYPDSVNTWIFGAIGKGGVAEKDISNNKKKVFCLNMPHRIPSMSTIIALYKFIKNIKPDVIHCSGAEANFHGFISAKFAKVPKIVLEEIGIPNHSRLARVIFRIIYMLADLIVGESKVVTDNLSRLYNIKPQKLKTVSNFCIFQKDLPVSKSTDMKKFNMISVSRLEPVKNLEALIRVIYKLKQEHYDVKYKILGDGSSSNNLLAMVKSLKLEEEIQFLGFVKDPTPHLLGANLYVLSSFSEGFSNSLLEAMYLKIPSLTTDVGAAREIITDGHNGWIVGADNEDELYKKIKVVIDLDNTVRTNIGILGSEKIIANYSLTAHASNLIEIYKS